jgi:hypothetical protein
MKSVDDLFRHIREGFLLKIEAETVASEDSELTSCKTVS